MNTCVLASPFHLEGLKWPHLLMFIKDFFFNLRKIVGYHNLFLRIGEICEVGTGSRKCEVAEYGKMWLISWWVVGDLREIGRCCWMMCAEL